MTSPAILLCTSTLAFAHAEFTMSFNRSRPVGASNMGNEPSKSVAAASGIEPSESNSDITPRTRPQTPNNSPTTSTIVRFSCSSTNIPVYAISFVDTEFYVYSSIILKHGKFIWYFLTRWADQRRLLAGRWRIPVNPFCLSSPLRRVRCTRESFRS